MRNKCGYTKKDLELIRNFTKEINEEIVIKISPQGNGFYCKLPNYKIYLGNKRPSQEELLWEQWYKEQDFFIGNDINRKIISLLHEIGHFQTFNIDEWLDRNKKVPCLTNRYYNGEMTFKELNYFYWNLINEYKATKWAIEYYKSNREKCERLAEMLNYKNYI